MTLQAFGQQVENGKTLFNDNCSVCHTIGKGRLVGPDLAGVDQRREKDWIFSFINNSGELIASGDATAKALFDEFKLAMPSHDFSNSELEDLLSYIAQAAAETPVAAVEITSSPVETLQANMEAPSWFILSLSFIGVVIGALLVVIFMLLKMVRRL